MVTKPSQLLKSSFRLLLVISSIVIFSNCGSPGTTDRQIYIEIDTLSPEIAFDTVRAPSISRDTLYKYHDTLHFDGQVFFVSQGDMLIPESEFEKLITEEWQKGQLEKFQKKISYPNQKIVIEYDLVQHDTIKWQQFPIRFCLDSASFTSKEKYRLARQYMLQAVQEWSGVCGVTFQYVASADKDPVRSTNPIDFVVKFERREDARYEAIAFGPKSPSALRQLRLFEPYWNTVYDPVGVLRHEIGHILGFRHEHAAYLELVPLACRIKFPEKDRPSRPVSRVYDSKSLMHYLCGGAGTRELMFSRYDSLGAVQVYGKK